jgi:hypothetical protein
MHRNHLVKILTIGIICLFVSVNFSTAISVDNKTGVNNKYKTNNKKIDYNVESTNNDYKENFDCSIVGIIGLSLGLRFLDGEGPLLSFLFKLAEDSLELSILLLPIFIYRQLYGPEHGGKIVMGEREDSYNEDLFPETFIYSVVCAIWTNGKNGTVEFKGEYFGQISIILDSWETSWGLVCRQWEFVGVEGFTGIKFFNPAKGVFFIIGNAEHIALGTKRPK